MNRNYSSTIVVVIVVLFKLELEMVIFRRLAFGAKKNSTQTTPHEQHSMYDVRVSSFSNSGEHQTHALSLLSCKKEAMPSSCSTSSDKVSSLISNQYCMGRNKGAIQA